MAARNYRIGEWDIPYKLRTLDMSRVAFYAENPRIYSRFAASESRTQEAIQSKLEQLDHVRTLRTQVDRDRQINEPLWCMEVEENSQLYGDFDYVALEGNSRLAALKMQKPTPPATDRVPCNILDLSGLSEQDRESFIFSLLGRIHITGKTDWQTYENAAYIYRRYRHQSVPAPQLAQELDGLTASKVTNTVKAYQLMLDNDDSRPANWSYYDVLVSGTKVRTARRDYPAVDEIVLPMIKKGTIGGAQKLREELPVIMADKKARKRFLEGDPEDRFEEALELAEYTGGKNNTLRKLEQFLRFVTQENTESEVAALLNADGTKGKTGFALDKIYDIVARLSPKARRHRKKPRGR